MIREGKSAGKPAETTEKNQKDDKKDAKSDGKKEGDATGDATAPAIFFHKLPDIVVNLNDKGSKTHFLKLSASLEIPDKESLKLVVQMQPRVMDSFQLYLRELRKSDLEGSAGIYRLREELLMRVNKTVYPAKVNNILFNEMITQ